MRYLLVVDVPDTDVFGNTHGHTTTDLAAAFAATLFECYPGDNPVTTTIRATAEVTSTYSTLVAALEVGADGVPENLADQVSDTLHTLATVDA